MPSVAAQLMRNQIKVLKPLLERVSIPAVRRGQDGIGALGATLYGINSVTEKVHFGNFEAEWIMPEKADTARTVLYLHGGGYVAGNLPYAMGYGSLLAKRTGCRVLCAAYRLAPENPFPAALDDALEAYRYALEATQTKNVALIGESAGGGLILALTLKLKSLGLELPAAIVAISPWTDLTQSGETYITNKKVDPTISKKSLDYWARLYAGDNLRDPFVSPLYGDVTGFPPTLIYCGADEVMRDDSRRFADKLAAVETPCEFRCVEGMWHGFPLYTLPEANEANERIAEFLREKLDERE